MANLCRSHNVVNANNDADNGAAAEQKKAVLTRQKTEEKRTRYKGFSKFTAAISRSYRRSSEA